MTEPRISRSQIYLSNEAKTKLNLKENMQVLIDNLKNTHGEAPLAMGNVVGTMIKFSKEHYSRGESKTEKNDYTPYLFSGILNVLESWGKIGSSLTLEDIFASAKWKSGECEISLNDKPQGVEQFEAPEDWNIHMLFTYLLSFLPKDFKKYNL